MVTRQAYEVPYNDDPEAQKAWGAYIKNLTEALASNRRGDAVALFMAYVGMPAAQIEGMRHAPFWGGMEALPRPLPMTIPPSWATTDRFLGNGLLAFRCPRW